MKIKPRYKINKYISIAVISETAGLILAVIIIRLLGIPNQGLLIIVILAFPILLYSCLRGFYRGLVNHYGFKAPHFQNNDKTEKNIK